jgi:ABC-type multidrug transport system fused ATPase/permease subunit
MKPFRTLDRYRRLLGAYLRPEWPRVAALGLILAGTISVQIATPLVASRFLDDAVSGAASRRLLLLALLTFGLAIAAQGLAVAETWVAEQLGWSATNALRIDLLAHLLRLDAGFHADHSPGELIERVDGDVGTLARFFSRFVINVIGNALLMIGVIVLLFTVDWRIGLGLSIFVVAALAIVLWIRAKGSPFFERERQAGADFYGFIGETLTGREDIRSSGAVAFVLRRCAERMRSWRTAILQSQMRGYGMVATTEGLFGLGAVVALAVSAVLYRDGTLTIGSVYLIFRYTEMLREPIEQIRNEIQDLQQADAGINRVSALLATEPRLVDGPGDRLPPGPLGVDLDEVTFGYDDAPILHGLTLRVEPKHVLGVIGRTGSGKTTLTRLIPRLYDPQAGTVRLGGVDLRAVSLQAVRSRVGVVTQDVQLFHASLRDNLTLFDDDVPDAEILRVLHTLGLEPWLSGLPAGLDSFISGHSLSAGQAQVLACARIFLRDPDIVILDEASSRLDPATERLVHEALLRLLEGRTGIIVAHRLATIDFVDDIVVMEDGRAVEHGSRAVLAADPGSRYAGLLRLAGEEVTV